MWVSAECSKSSDDIKIHTNYELNTSCSRLTGGFATSSKVKHITHCRMMYCFRIEYVEA